jgi:hypothetical protein
MDLGVRNQLPIVNAPTQSSPVSPSSLQASVRERSPAPVGDNESDSAGEAPPAKRRMLTPAEREELDFQTAIRLSMTEMPAPYALSPPPGPSSPDSELQVEQIIEIPDSDDERSHEAQPQQAEEVQQADHAQQLTNECYR